jgi:hypothetical protein
MPVLDNDAATDGLRWVCIEHGCFDMFTRPCGGSKRRIIGANIPKITTRSAGYSVRDADSSGYPTPMQIRGHCLRSLPCQKPSQGQAFDAKRRADAACCGAYFAYPENSV